MAVLHALSGACRLCHDSSRFLYECWRRI